jgi:hypothetical protein
VRSSCYLRCCSRRWREHNYLYQHHDHHSARNRHPDLLRHRHAHRDCITLRDRAPDSDDHLRVPHSHTYADSAANAIRVRHRHNHDVWHSDTSADDHGVDVCVDPNRDRYSVRAERNANTIPWLPVAVAFAHTVTTTDGDDCSDDDHHAESLSVGRDEIRDGFCVGADGVCVSVAIGVLYCVARCHDHAVADADGLAIH